MGPRIVKRMYQLGCVKQKTVPVIVSVVACGTR